MKKTISLILAILMLTLVFTGCDILNFGDSGDESESEYENNESNSVEEESESKREESPVTDFEYMINTKTGNMTITKYIGKSSEVVIPEAINGEPVKVIGESAFANSDVETVHIPDSVEAILQLAFYKCEKLTYVRFSQNLVNRIGWSAFSGCKSLKKADLSSSGLKMIDEGAFEDCESLEEVTLGENINVIAQEAFMNCTSLHTINLPKNLEELGHYAFFNCNFKTLTIPKSIQKWGIYAFANSLELSEVIFEDGLKTISGSFLFGPCLVETVTIPASVESIDDCIFFKSKLKTVIFEGDAPNVRDTKFNMPFDVDNQPVTIYYDPEASGWDTTPMKDYYTLVPMENT